MEYSDTSATQTMELWIVINLQEKFQFRWGKVYVKCEIKTWWSYNDFREFYDIDWWITRSRDLKICTDIDRDRTYTVYAVLLVS
jgi:hypothetical protein